MIDKETWVEFKQPFGDDSDFLHQGYRYHRRIRGGELVRFSKGDRVPDRNWDLIVTPSPAELRAELERLVMTDLLGPSSPDEQLPGVRTPVREWYLVGMLAPKGTIVDPNRGDDGDLPGDDEGGAPGPDGQPAKVVLFPSSVGFTAAVELTCSSLTVSASWGRYEKIPNPDPTATGPTSGCGSGIPRADR